MICPYCGALVGDELRHDNWHDELDRRLAERQEGPQ